VKHDLSSCVIPIVDADTSLRRRKRFEVADSDTLIIWLRLLFARLGNGT
jgi:hypothetical protein